MSEYQCKQCEDKGDYYVMIPALDLTLLIDCQECNAKENKLCEM